jgi:hypothetical protein
MLTLNSAAAGAAAVAARTSKPAKAVFVFFGVMVTSCGFDSPRSALVRVFW